MSQKNRSDVHGFIVFCMGMEMLDANNVGEVKRVIRQKIRSQNLTMGAEVYEETMRGYAVVCLTQDNS